MKHMLGSFRVCLLFAIVVVGNFFPQVYAAGLDGGNSALVGAADTASRNDELTVELHKQEMETLRQDLRRANRRSVHAVVGAALIICAAVLLGFNAQGSIDVWRAPLLSWLLGGVGVGLLLGAWPLTDT